MKKYTNEISIIKPFGNLLRSRHALVLLQDLDNNYLLGEKPNFYPENIYRFVGGGIDTGETPLEGVLREVEEELSLLLESEQLIPLAEVVTIATDDNHKVYQNSTYLYKLVVTEQEKIKVGDDVKGIMHMNYKEMKDLIQRYEDLSENHWYVSDDGYSHSWGDYGKMYSFIHRIGLELTK